MSFVGSALRTFQSQPVERNGGQCGPYKNRLQLEVPPLTLSLSPEYEGEGTECIPH
jgi:hypothetical protein